MSSKNIQNINNQLKENSLEEIKNFLSEYNIKGIIGRGTFSIVKLGEHKLTKEKVAIKIMQKNKIINQEDLIRIEREIQMLKCLNHINVIKIYNILEDIESFYIIMEYCENGELFNRIVEKKRLTEDESAIFYYQLINGLEYIHNNNIVHRDLKPENLLLSKDDILKIIDFGLSNYSKYNILLGTPCGSPCYASPEMVSGKKYNGFLIDIWSSGIILFAMICGYLPFEDNNNEILFGKILKCKINYPKHIGELPLDLMKKIIVPDPNKRITLQQIKEHPFFLRGKSLFNQKYLNLSNEDKNKNINPIKCQIIKNKLKKEFKLNNFLNNYYVPKKEYDFTNYKPCFSENNDRIFNNINDKIYIQNISNKKKNINNDINILNTKSFDFCESGKNIKENNDENKGKKNNINNSENKIKHFKSILNTSQIPRFCNSKERKNHQNNLYMKHDLNLKIKEPKEKEKYNIIKDEINTMNSTNITDFQSIFKNIINIHNPRNDLNENSQRFTKDLKRDFIFRRNRLKAEANKTKSPESIKKKYIFPNDNNTITGQIIEEYNPFGKKNYQKGFGNHSSFNQRIELKYKDRKTNVVRKPKYSYIKEKEFKNFYDNTQNDSNLELINKMKINSDSNSVPKYNDKNNYYLEENNPNNIYTKINNKNINKKIEKNHNVFNTNNFKVNYINESNRNTVNYKIRSRLNKYAHDKYLNNTTSQEKINKEEINDIFDELQLIKKNKNKTLDQNKNNIINQSNKVTRLYQNNNPGSQLFENQLIGLSKKNTNIFPSNRRDIFHLNKYVTEINTTRIVKTKAKTKNINNYSELKDSFEINHKINNDKFNNNENINNFNITNNEKYRNGNSNSLKGIRIINNKGFENVIINNNNSINIHEPKLYIYLENNNSNNNSSQNNRENLKTFNNKTQKSKLIFKDEKNYYNDFSGFADRKSINTIIEHTENILNRKKKKINTNILDIKNIKKSNKLVDNNRYVNDNDIYKINKNNNRSTNMISDLVKFNNESINENNKKFNLAGDMKNNNNNIYNLTEANSKENYLYKSNDALFKLPSKYKEKKIKHSHKSTNTIYNYVKKETNRNNKSFKNSLKINKGYEEKSDYSFKNLHNFTKTDVNMDIFDYDDKNKRPNLENIMINHYLINNKQPKTLTSKKYNFINNSNYMKYKEKSLLSLDNITNEDFNNNFNIMNNKNYDINNNNLRNGMSEKYKYLMPIKKIAKLEPFAKFRKLKTIVTDRTHSPLIDKNYQSIIDYQIFSDK